MGPVRIRGRLRAAGELVKADRRNRAEQADSRRDREEEMERLRPLNRNAAAKADERINQSEKDQVAALGQEIVPTLGKGFANLGIADLANFEASLRGVAAAA